MSDSLRQFLIDKNIYQIIKKQCKPELKLSTVLEDYVENELLIALNNLDQINSIDIRVNQAVFILFGQAIKTFKSCLLLSTNGYFVNTLIDSRNILEIIFNIKYILEEPCRKLKRAEDYLTKENYWADDNVKNRAFLGLEDPLYEVYKIICNYSHANYMGTGQNFDGESISINPSEEKIKFAIEFVNSLYYYLIKFITNYYNICLESFSKIEVYESFKELINLYETEQDIINYVLDMLFNVYELKGQNKEEWIRDYKKTNFNRKRKVSKF